MAKLDKLHKVNESISLNRHDNGWMVDISGKDKNNDWKSSKTVCNTEEELINLIKECNKKELDN